MTWVYFWWSMSSLGDLAEPFEHQLLTLGEAAEVLRIGRSLGYQLAHEYLNSGGTSGLPVVRLGEKCLRKRRTRRRRRTPYQMRASSRADQSAAQQVA